MAIQSWKHIGRLSLNLRYKVQAAGGWLGAARKATQIVRLEGMHGLRRRVAMAIGLSSQRYSEWIRRYDTLTDETRAKMRRMIEGFARKPLMSVVTPYNPKPEWLKEAIESVRHQIYPRWELCIADDASTDPCIRPILENYARMDSRINVVNGHICAASNSALELVSGEFDLALRRTLESQSDRSRPPGASGALTTGG